jgi:hypothetical protein
VDDDTNQYMSDFPRQDLVQAGLETAAWVAVVVVTLTVLRRRRAAAGLLLLGALMSGLAMGVFFAEYAEPRFLDSFHVFKFLVLDHPHVQDAVAWVRVAGGVVAAAAVVMLLRSPRPGGVPENDR